MSSMRSKVVQVGYGSVSPVSVGPDLPLVFIGGPCAIESRDHAFMMADKITSICQELSIPFIYKSCFDKDCRSSPNSFHGLGIPGLDILADVRHPFVVALEYGEGQWWYTGTMDVTFN